MGDASSRATAALAAETEEQVEQEYDADRRDRPEEAQPTGEPAVDAVLASLERLHELPVAEHVAVYESAHSALREALNRAGDA